MKVKELRLGNLIKVIPRENQEGLLAIAEIQKETVIGEMITPRAGYHFRLKFDEIILIPLSEEWLMKFGYEKDLEKADCWKDKRQLLNFHFPSEGKKLFMEAGKPVGNRSVEHLHDFQNLYYFLTGEELSVTT